MKIRIRELCDGQNITSAYQLAKAAKLTMPTAYRAFADDIKQFTPETLERLCKALECSPNDIFGYEVGTVKTGAPTVPAVPDVPDVQAVPETGGWSVRAAAAQLGYSEAKVRSMIHNKSLSSHKVGGRRMVDEKALLEFEKNPKKTK